MSFERPHLSRHAERKTAVQTKIGRSKKEDIQMELRKKKARLRIIQIFEQRVKNETELQAHLLPHHLALGNPNRSSPAAAASVANVVE